MRLTIQLILGLALLTVLAMAGLSMAAAGVIGTFWHGSLPQAARPESVGPSGIVLMMMAIPVLAIPSWWLIQCVQAKRHLRELESGLGRAGRRSQLDQPIATAQDKSVFSHRR